MADRLGSFELGGRTYCHGHDKPSGDALTPRAQLLLILDEYYRRYQYSRDLLDVAVVKAGKPPPAGVIEQIRRGLGVAAGTTPGR